MSKYTTELRFICENLAGYTESKGANSVDSILDECWDKIFDSFDIFEAEYRPVLCKKILKHYYTREIGFETYGLFKLKLNTKMQEIMPYYNQMYYTVNLEYDPLHQIDYTRTVNDARTKASSISDSSARTVNTSENDTGQNASNETNGNVKRDLFSNTPQGGLTGVENGNYLTTAEKITDDSTSANNSSYNKNVSKATTNNFSREGGENENNYGTLTEVITGKRGGDNYSTLIKDYRTAIVNVDMMIINELKDLFLNLW